ncbi:MAG: hypothetical protein NVV62_14800 [Terricaulis sp.]|nr:hypothetical protein [Terricaulis sp.]
MLIARHHALLQREHGAVGFGHLRADRALARHKRGAFGVGGVARFFVRGELLGLR